MEGVQRERARVRLGVRGRTEREGARRRSPPGSPKRARRQGPRSRRRQRAPGDHPTASDIPGAESRARSSATLPRRTRSPASTRASVERGMPRALHAARSPILWTIVRSRHCSSARSASNTSIIGDDFGRQGPSKHPHSGGSPFRLGCSRRASSERARRTLPLPRAPRRPCYRSCEESCRSRAGRSRQGD
jgi:hypothetical protein